MRDKISRRDETGVCNCNKEVVPNALVESVIGLFKTEVIRHDGFWKGVEDVKLVTPDWVAWFNDQQFLGPIGHIPPVELEQLYARQQRSGLKAVGLD